MNALTKVTSLTERMFLWQMNVIDSKKAINSNSAHAVDGKLRMHYFRAYNSNCWALLATLLLLFLCSYFLFYLFIIFLVYSVTLLKFIYIAKCLQAKFAVSALLYLCNYMHARLWCWNMYRLSETFTVHAFWLSLQWQYHGQEKD